jgi:hypothetical protein
MKSNGCNSRSLDVEDERAVGSNPVRDVDYGTFEMPANLICTSFYYKLIFFILNNLYK